MQSGRGQVGPGLWMAALAVVVIAAAGGFFVRQLYRQQPEPTADTSVARAEPTQPSTSKSPNEQPGPSEVKARLDFKEHPLQSEIWPMLREHFDSINELNYEKWRKTVTSKRAANFPKETWEQDYRTTKDGSILVHRVDWAPDRKLRVMISFTSTQDIENAPPELPKECIRWRIVLPLTKEEGNKWKIDTGPEGTSPRHDECGSGN